jgi:hypothetical protein
MGITKEEMTYGILIDNPSAWIEQADCLKISAELIWAKFMEIEPLPQTLPGVRVQWLAFMQSYMLLMGLSFENLIKGVHISRTPQLSPEKRMVLWRKYRNGHGIAKMIELIDSVNLEEGNLLKRLEEFTIWAGRYPIPSSSCQYSRSRTPENLLAVTTRDPGLCDGLFKRLSAMVATTTH